MSLFVTVATFGCLLGVTLVWSLYHIPLPAEVLEREDLKHGEYCGGVINGWAATPPFIRVLVLGDSVEISFKGKSWLIRYAEIDSVTICRLLVLRGVCIEHHSSTAPREIVLQSIRNNRLAGMLSRMVQPPSVESASASS